MKPVTVRVDSRLRISGDVSADVVMALKRATEHTNPDYAKKRSMGYQTWGVPQFIRTWQNVGGELTLPRGAMGRLRAIFKSEGVEFRIVDKRTEGAPLVRGLKYVGFEPRAYQHAASDACIAREQGVVRAPTGSGKSLTMIYTAARIGLNTLIILPSVKLLDQTREVVASLLGIGGDRVGIIQGSKRRLRPITLATQQTLWSRAIDAEPREFFGAVMIDECFESRTPVLMDDGTTRSISEIREGDRVALGGVVRRTMRRFYEGPICTLGGFLVTPEHPVATSHGWKGVGSLDSGSDVYYDPLHAERTAVSRLQETTTPGLSRRSLSAMSAEEFRRGALCDVREVRSSEVAGLTPLDALRNDRTVERWTDERDVAVDSARGGGSAGQAQGVIASSHACSMARSESSRGLERVLVAGTDGALFPSRGGGEASTSNPRAYREGIPGVWGEGARQRSADASDRDEDVSSSFGARLRAGEEREDRLAWDGSSDPLQDRPDSSSCEDRSGDRRKQSSGSGGDRREEDLLPRVKGVVGLALPGAVRLRPGRPRVRRLADDAALSVFNLETENGVYVAGGVLVHNCHHAAAQTHQAVIDQFPARFRLAFSADEKRRDRKEFLVYDAFGDVLHETTREECEDVGAVVDVEVRLVPTEFDAPWYREEQNFNALLDAMTSDERRNKIVIDIAREELAMGEQVILCTHRREHVRALDRALIASGVRSGCMLGGADAGDSAEFDATRAGLRAGSVAAGVGTYGALGEGIDLPAVAVGVAVTPIASNKQKFGQFRGRLCRPSEGKRQGRLYVPFDRRVFDERMLTNIFAWNKTVTVRVGGAWVDARTHKRAIMSGRV